MAGFWSKDMNPRQGWVLLALVGLSGCSTCGIDPQVDNTSDRVEAQLGRPSRSWTHADGSTRWAYAYGAYSRRTCMVDFDAQGGCRRPRTCWTKPTSCRCARHDGRRAGTAAGPARLDLAGAYHHQTVWSYRYENPFCQVFHVGMTPAGIVEDSAHGLDPICDDDHDR
jgi:hypothetical protein